MVIYHNCKTNDQAERNASLLLVAASIKGGKESLVLRCLTHVGPVPVFPWVFSQTGYHTALTWP